MTNVHLQSDHDTLPSLLQKDGVVGVSRLRIDPAFGGRAICTLIYLPTTVRVSINDARELGQFAFRGTVTRPLDRFRRFGALASWKTLRAAAFASPSCSSRSLDGVCYVHAALDWEGGVESRWCNPELWPAHQTQCEIVDAYESLIKSESLLKPGTAVRIRDGALSGCLGRIDRVDRYRIRVHVIAEMMGGRVTVELAASDIEPVSE